VAKPRSSSKGVVIFVLLVAAGFVAYRYRRLPEPLTPAAVHRPLIAILIFDNLNGQPEMDFLANAFTRETTAAIGQLGRDSLDVIGHRSTVTYRDTRKTLHQIGRELGIDYVLEGGIQKRGAELTVTAGLTRSSDQQRLWTETYRRSFSQAFMIQNEIVQKIAATLGIGVTQAAIDQLNHGSTNSAVAREAYLRGVDRCENDGPAALKECIALLRNAVKADPEYGRAHAALAAALVQLPDERRAAEPHARQAVAIADGLPQAHAALAEVLHRLHHDVAGADNEFRKAIALNPSDAHAHSEYAGFLMENARLGESHEEIRRSLLLDPYALDTNVMAGRIFAAEKFYERAMDQLEKAVTMDRTNPQIRFYLGQVYLARFMYDDAIREFQRAISFGPGNPEYVAALQQAMQAAGRK
jgi:TolB-like protein/cytochrome c-type biogenesis protein CcmH/NrfG